MINAKEIGVSLIVAMHTAIGAIAAGETGKALIYAAAGAGCYLIIRGALWLGDRIFDSDKNSQDNNLPDEEN